MSTPILLFAASLLGLVANVSPDYRESVRKQDALAIPVAPSADSAMGVRLLDGADGAHYVSWVERHGDESRLLFSKLDETLAWGSPKTIASGSDWFVNWADYPVLASLADGTLAATWLQSIGGENERGYGARISFSGDGGELWSEPTFLHDDSAGPEYGFVSLAAMGPDTFGAVWLDSRNIKGGAHGAGSMALYFRRFAASGAPGPELLLDDRVCDCCSTATVVDGSGALQVVYRDRDAEEIRDVSLVTLGGPIGFDRRATIADNWKIPGCPVNGPSLASHGAELSFAWFTAADGKSAVKVATSKDGGASFGFPTKVDLGGPMGRALACYDKEGALFVAWLEAPALGSNSAAKWLMVKVGGDEKPRVLAEVEAGRASGFASLTKAPGGGLLFAWTTAPTGQDKQTGVTSSHIH
jgi:hypothetical protein